MAVCAIARPTLIPRMSFFACLAFLDGSGGAYGDDGIMNPRRFAIVAPTFCGTVVLEGSIAGWLASAAGTQNARAVPIEDRAASLATDRLADEPQAIAMANAFVANTVVANATVASAEAPTAAEPAALPTRRRYRINRS